MPLLPFALRRWNVCSHQKKSRKARDEKLERGFLQSGSIFKLLHSNRAAEERSRFSSAASFFSLSHSLRVITKLAGRLSGLRNDLLIGSLRIARVCVRPSCGWSRALAASKDTDSSGFLCVIVPMAPDSTRSGTRRFCSPSAGTAQRRNVALGSFAT